MDGIEMIAVERQRQVEVEGWTPEHDDGHQGGEMACAAAAFALMHTHKWNIIDQIRPWSSCELKWKEPIRNLVRAGALIAAEIDRLQRIGPPKEES